LVRQHVKSARKAFNEKRDSLDVHKLKSIAEVRFAVTQAAVWMHQVEIDQDPAVTPFAEKLKLLFAKVQRMCEIAKSDLPRFGT
jgi:hypothetical protein